MFAGSDEARADKPSAERNSPPGFGIITVGTNHAGSDATIEAVSAIIKGTESLANVDKGCSGNVRVIISTWPL